MPAERRAAAAGAFQRAFGRAPEGIADAPGRVNLIGEHVDYHGGLVLPFAIDRGVAVAWARNGGATLRAYAADFDARGDAPLDALAPLGRGAWQDYVRGVAAMLRKAGHALGGLDLSIAGDVPPAAGLSSSAAIEVAVAGAMRDAFVLEIDDVALARLCQRAENEFVGVQSGIMDQFASALSRRGHALLIDCATLAYEHIPLRIDEAGMAVVIANSGVRRELASSAYNARREESAAGLQALRDALSRPNATYRDFAADEVALLAIQPDDVPLRRARHIVTEIARVRAAVAALRRDDFAVAGGLLNASHASLRDDYEVSVPDLDLLVELAQAQPYVAGARLTGAGFGGCTVNLVRAPSIDAFERDVMGTYRARTGHAVETYVTTPCGGLSVRRLP